uniref:Uncharacterized protein n=1 Tax=viral metagenome TaxID=1070528 RepID=A0A6M3KGR3_9ZZZZ
MSKEEKVIRLLKEIEWMWSIHEEQECPICQNSKDFGGHLKTCQLAKAIALLEAIEPKIRDSDKEYAEYQRSLQKKKVRSSKPISYDSPPAPEGKPKWYPASRGMSFGTCND